ncbi:MAG: glycosyltransferase family 39 protein [Lentisphaeria bacterium]|nr:glycosyltransferase family 39 protein [Lentisphaeria bacterium]
MENCDKKTFFDRPARAAFILIAALAVVWSLQCFLTQRVLGKDVVETVMWGSLGALGHLKHPPLSGWIGWAVARLTGYSDFAMYLAAQVFLLFGSWYVYRLARLFLNETESAVSVLLLYVLFYYNPSSMKFCSHFVEAAFMPAMVYHIVRGSRENRLTDWLLAGVFSALAVLGKYSAVIVLPGCLAYILYDRERRKCFLKPGLWLGILTGILLLVPHLVWLAQHDFCCLLHVKRRISDDVMPWYYFLIVIAVGIMPVALDLAVLFLMRLPGWKTRMRKPVSREVLVLSLLLTLIPTGVLAVAAILGGDVVLMWFSFLAAWTGIAAAALFPWEIDRKVFRNLWLLVVIYTFAALLVSTIDVMMKPRLRIHSDPKEIVRDVEKYYRTYRPEGKLPPLIGERWICGVVQFYSPDHPQAFSVSDPVTLAPYLPEIRRNGALLLGDEDKIRQWLPDLAGKVKFHWFQVTYRAASGKTKSEEYVIAYYPGESGGR